MRDIRITWAEVHRGHAERGEERDVGPSELRKHVAANGLNESRRSRLVQAGPRTGSAVDQAHLELRNNSTDAVERLLDGDGSARTGS